MSARRSSIVLITLTVVLAALAAVVRFVVAPGLTELPGDTDLTVRYAGRATMLDDEALRSGDTAHAVRSGIPVTVDRSPARRRTPSTESAGRGRHRRTRPPSNPRGAR